MYFYDIKFYRMQSASLHHKEHPFISISTFWAFQSLLQAIFVGYLVGCFFWGYLSDRYGRRCVSFRPEEFIKNQKSNVVIESFGEEKVTCENASSFGFSCQRFQCSFRKKLKRSHFVSKQVFVVEPNHLSLE